jgi:hypothetical protein
MLVVLPKGIVVDRIQSGTADFSWNSKLTPICQNHTQGQSDAWLYPAKMNV